MSASTLSRVEAVKSRRVLAKLAYSYKALDASKTGLEKVTETFGDCSVVCDRIKNGCSVEDAMKTANEVENMTNSFHNDLRVAPNLSAANYVLRRRLTNEPIERHSAIRLAFTNALDREKERRSVRQNEYDEAFNNHLNSDSDVTHTKRKLIQLNKQYEKDFVTLRNVEEAVSYTHLTLPTIYSV